MNFVILMTYVKKKILFTELILILYRFQIHSYLFILNTTELPFSESVAV